LDLDLFPEHPEKMWTGEELIIFISPAKTSALTHSSTRDDVLYIYDWHVHWNKVG